MIRSRDDCDKRIGEVKMKCYNSFCPFRINDDSDENNCECECGANNCKK